MAASDNLLRMHEVARGVKNKHDIDIMFPHGVKIGGKPYPALNKSISTGKSLPHVGFVVPLENGHIVHITAYDDGKSHDGLRDIPAAVGATVAFPHENGSHDFMFEENKEMYRKHSFWTPEHGTTSDLANKINEWSKEPGIGIRYKKPLQGNYTSETREIVPPEELTSHYQKHKKNRADFLPDHHPNLIKVDNLDSGNKFWDYNITTEEFKNTQGGD